MMRRFQYSKTLRFSTLILFGLLCVATELLAAPMVHTQGNYPSFDDVFGSMAKVTFSEPSGTNHPHIYICATFTLGTSDRGFSCFDKDWKKVSVPSSLSLSDEKVSLAISAAFLIPSGVGHGLQYSPAGSQACPHSIAGEVIPCWPSFGVPGAMEQHNIIFISQEFRRAMLSLSQGLYAGELEKMPTPLTLSGELEQSIAYQDSGIWGKVLGGAKKGLGAAFAFGFELWEYGSGMYDEWDIRDALPALADHIEDEVLPDIEEKLNTLIEQWKTINRYCSTELTRREGESEDEFQARKEKKEKICEERLKATNDSINSLKASQDLLQGLIDRFQRL